jgi:hypothetical protein
METMRSTWTDERLDDGFGHLDRRFDEVGRRFERLETSVDRRFDTVDRRLERSETRLELLTAEMIELRRDMNAGFESLHTLLVRLGFGLGFSMFLVLLTAFLAAR